MDYVSRERMFHIILCNNSEARRALEFVMLIVTSPKQLVSSCQEENMILSYYVFFCHTSHI